MPIGIQDFEKLREAQCVYVDKTSFVWDLAKTVSPYFLSRPRRFGKSLFLSTLNAYFLGKKKLFKGLALEKLEKQGAKQEKRKAWQVYPVFYLDLNSKKYDAKNSLIKIIDQHLDKWEKTFAISPKVPDVDLRFINLLQTAHEKTGLKAVILVDEYDKPLLETLDNLELLEDYRKTLKSFFGVIKSEDAHIRFAFLTGVTKFSQVSIFSDLNNLHDISMEESFSSICGISENELKDNFDVEISNLAEKNKLSKEQCLAKLKQTYDGYHFSINSEGVYNPFSLLNTFASGEFKYYWFKTGTPTFLIKGIEQNHFDIRTLVEGVTATEESFSEYRYDYATIEPLLYQAGYLTIKDYDSRFHTYTLKFPNEEVKYGFLSNLLPIKTNVVAPQGSFYIEKFVRDIESSNIDDFMTRMQSILSSVPYSVNGEKTLVSEQTFHTGIFLVFQLMGQFTQCEVHSAKGRADCVVWTKDAIYVFEFKLNGTKEEALKQIDDKSYAIPYKCDNRKIVKIGVGFEKDTPVIKDWLVSE